MERSDNRSPSEDGNHSQETTESNTRPRPSLEMDCSEPFSDQAEESNTQEMKSVSGSLESYMDCSEETEQNEEEENDNENSDNGKESDTSGSSQLSVTVTVSSGGSGSQDLSSGSESSSQDNNTFSTCLSQNSLTVTISSSGTCGQDLSSGSESPSQEILLNVAVIATRMPQNNSRKRKNSGDGENNMNKRREV